MNNVLICPGGRCGHVETEEGTTGNVKSLPRRPNYFP